MKAPARVVPELCVGAMRRPPLRLALALALLSFCGVLHGATSGEKAVDKVSYYRDVRPILQANCQGCHQPAKAKGGYVMTEFQRLLDGGEGEGKAVVPGHADESALVKMVSPNQNEARTPKGKSRLTEVKTR